MTTRDVGSSDESQQLYAEQVRQLFAGLPLGLLAGQVNAAILVYVQWGVIGHQVLLLWFGLLTLATVVRYAIVGAYRRNADSREYSPFWVGVFVLGTVVSGAIWGSAGIFLFSSDLSHQIFIIFVLAGMTAGAVVSFSALWQVGLLFIVLTLTPLSARLFIEGKDMHLAMGVMSLIFMVLMVVITRRMYQTTLTSLKLRFENNDLIDVLAQGKAATEKLNRELQREIDERARVEAGLRESEAHLRTLFDSVPDGIVTINDQGLLESANPAAERIFGCHKRELVGRHFKTLMPEADRDGYDDYMRAHIGAASGKTIGFGLEITGERKDGSTFPMELGISQMWLDHRHWFIGIVRDISERREVERMKNQFLSTVNHELRTPLTSVLGSLGLLSEGIAGELSERGKSLLGITRSNVERLVRLIGNILDMDEIQSGRMQMDFRPVVLSRLVENALEDGRPLASVAGVALTMSDTAPRGLVYADAGRLSQTFGHLLSNAIKYSPRGSTVRVAVEPVAGSLRVSVVDQGPGIPEEFRARIFQPFSQAGTGDADFRSGAGLGLSIARAIVEQHAGVIGFEPGLATGARFYFELPELHNSALESTTDFPE